MASVFLRDFLRYIRNGELWVEEKRENHVIKIRAKAFHDGENHSLIRDFLHGSDESRT